jgi:hypothetical protein
MYYHKYLPIVDRKFFKVLIGKCAELMESMGEEGFKDFRTNETNGFHPLDLNISMMDLPGVTDPDIIKAYNTIFTLDPEAREAIASNNLKTFLSEHRAFAVYGFQKGFGTALFSSLVSEAYQQSEQAEAGKLSTQFYKNLGKNLQTVSMLGV